MPRARACSRSTSTPRARATAARRAPAGLRRRRHGRRRAAGHRRRMHGALRRAARAGEQRGTGQLPAVPRDHRRRLPQVRRHQPEGHLHGHARGLSGADRGARRGAQHRVHAGAGGLPPAGRVLDGQGRRDRPHAQPRGRLCRPGHPRQRDRTGHHRHAADRGAAEHRALPGHHRRHHADGPARPARGGGRRGRLPVQRRRGLRHGPGAGRRRGQTTSAYISEPLVQCWAEAHPDR